MNLDKLQRPGGTKDYLPVIAAKKKHIEEKLDELFSRWGYEQIITPTFEYYNVLYTATESLQDKMYKFFNRQGEIFALRPEMTAPIARVVATELKEQPLPLRLSYLTNVFRYETPRAGRYREFYQAGVELFGVSTPMGDAEVIALATRALEEVGLKRFKLDIGDVDYFLGIVKAANLNSGMKSKIRTALSERNFVKLEELLVNSDLGVQKKEAILKGAKLRGDLEVIDKAKKLVENEESLQALENLKSVYQNLQLLGVEDYIQIDLGVVRGFDYYTGIVFEGYTKDLGYTLCGGGSYDELVGKFGYSVPATGFAIGIDRLLLSLQRQDYDFSTDKGGILLLITEEQKKMGFKLAADLREEGKKVELGLIDRPLDEAISYARKKGLEKIIVPGEEDLTITSAKKELKGIEVMEIELGQEGLDE